MGKVNLAKAMDAIREESFTPHPYWGYKCSRGLWLTRFPLETMPENPAFMLAFIEAGGNLDAMGHHGESPESIREKEETGWSLQEIALLGKGVPADLCGVIGLDETNWKVYKRGLNRAEALNQNGIGISCSVWTLGRKSLSVFLKKLFSKGFKISQRRYASTPEGKNADMVINNYVYYRRAGIATTRGGTEYQIKEALIIEGIVSYEVGLLHPKLLEFCRQDVPTRKEKNMNHYSPFQRPVSKLFSCPRAAKIFFSLVKMRRSFYFTAGKREFYPQIASVGRIAQIHADLLVSVKDGNFQLHSIRNVAGHSVCKIADTWFIWNGDFNHHFEGKGSLKSVIELAERRKKKNSPILTLNDIRNDRPGTAGFCLAGTKGFLEKRMPHLYRIVAGYSSWGEVPEDIATIEWHIADLDIFSGYPNPVVG